MTNILIVILHLLAVIDFIISANPRHRQQKPKIKYVEPTNNNIFEKYDYEVFNKTLMKDLWIFMRPIAPNVYKVNASFEITDPINEIWYQYQLFRKYNTYQKFLIDMNMEMCGIFNKTSSNPLASVLLENNKRIEQMDGFYTNIKPQCPFYGHYELWHTGFNSSLYSFPLVPSGQYRVDVTTRRTKDGPKIMKMRFFGHVSDLRVWF